jgi:peptidyl-prolyl cis-trans isomerase D
MLSAEAREVVFGADGPGVVGPVDTPLGPSLYRINAVLDAQSVPFEEARDELAQQRATEAAEAMILDDLAAIEDLIAGGAKLEEIASETVMQLGEIELNDDSTDPLAVDPGFRAAADAAVEGEETDLVELEGGGYATLRLEAVEPPTLIPLGEIRGTVATDWHAAQVAAALAERAQGYATEIEQGLAIADLAERLGAGLQTAPPMARGEALPGTPPRLVADLFAADEGDVVIVEDGAAVILAELTVVEPYDPDDPAMAGIRDTLRQQYTGQAADDALALFTAAVRDRAGVRINQGQIDATLGRFQ